jgi:tRNA threonylcarbamoyladenosine biosynthesis protein TsaB
LLPRYIEELLSFAREQGLSIEAVALSEGPGSYTGLRIGASTAKGLCYGLNIPLIPVPTLDILCEAARKSLCSEVNLEAVLIPMIDARRMEVYTKVDGETKAVVVENEESLMNEGMKELMNEGKEVYYFGDGAEKCSRIFTKPNWHFLSGIVPEAQYMGALAEQIINHKFEIINHKFEITNHQSIDLAYYEPFYLKEFIAAPSHVKGLN